MFVLSEDNLQHSYCIPNKEHLMSIFKKVKNENGRRKIYFCGIKVLSYKKERERERKRVRAA